MHGTGIGVGLLLIMFTMTSIVASTLTLAPPPTPTPKSFDASDVEVTLGRDSIQWATFDADGDQSSNVVLVSDGENGATIDITFADGLYFVAVIDSEGRIIDAESPDTDEVFERLSAVTEIDAPQGDGLRSEVMCYAGVIAAGGCFVGALFPCMSGALLISCHCLPYLNGTPTPGCD